MPVFRSRSARNWIIVAVIVLGLPASCFYSFYRLTRTEPVDSPIVQAFLIDDDGNRPSEVYTYANPERVSDPRLDVLRGLSATEAQQIMKYAGFGCSPRKDSDRPAITCVRGFATVAGAGDWHLHLQLDAQGQVDSISATRWGHCPHY